MIGACFAFLAVFGVYLRLMSPAIALEDSGEFATAAVTLSLTHPPGYPLYALLGKLFSIVPLGSPGFRLVVFSAVCAAAAACFLADFIRRLTRNEGLFPCAAAVAFAFAPALVTQATLVNKYAFNAALLCLLFTLSLKALKEGTKSFPALFLMLGLSFSHHMQTIYILPALAGLLYKERLQAKPRLAAALLVMLLLGLSLKPLVLSLSSANIPSLMYGKLDSAGRLLPYLLAREYSERFTAFGFADRLARLWSHGIKLTFQEAGLPALLLSILGAVWLWKERKSVLLAGLAGGALSVYLVSIFQITGVEKYYVLPFAAFVCALAGAGLAVLSNRYGRTLAALAAVVLISESFVRGIRANDLSRYYGTFDRGRNILQSADPGAVLMTQNDDELYPAMYLKRVLGERRDVALVHRPFMTRRWHHQEAERIHPGFQVLNPGLIPWGRTVSPEEIINIFFRSHLSLREVALTYVRPAEMAGGFRLTPSGTLERLGRIDGPPPPRAREFKARLARFRMRGTFDLYEGRDPRFREVAGVPAGLWVQLATLWINLGDKPEARKCLREAMRFPHNRTSAKDMERLRLLAREL